MISNKNRFIEEKCRLDIDSFIGGGFSGNEISNNGAIGDGVAVPLCVDGQVPPAASRQL